MMMLLQLWIPLALALDLEVAPRADPVALQVPDLSLASLVVGDGRLRIGGARSVAFSPDSAQVAVAGPNGIRVFDRATGSPTFIAPLFAYNVAWTGPTQLRAGHGRREVVEVDLTDHTVARVAADHSRELGVHVAWDDFALSLDEDGGATFWKGSRSGHPGNAAVDRIDGGLSARAWAGPGGVLYRRQSQQQVWLSPEGDDVATFAGSVVAAAVRETDVLVVEEVDESRHAVLRRIGRDGVERKRFSLPVEAFWHAALSPDGARLAVWSQDRGLRVWDIATQSLVSESFPLAGRAGAEQLVFSPDGAWLALPAGADLVVVDAATGRTPVQVPRWDPVRALAVDETVAWSDGREATWTASAKGDVVRIPRAAEQLAVSGDRVYGVDHHRLFAWDLAAGALSWDEQHPSEFPCIPLAVSADGERVAHSHAFREIVVHDAADGSQRAAWPLGDGTHNHEVWDLVFDASGEHLASASTGAEFQRDLLTIWDAATGAQQAQHVSNSYDLLGLFGETWAYDDARHLREGPTGERGEPREGLNGLSASADGSVRLLSRESDLGMETVLEVDGVLHPLWPMREIGAVSASGERVALALRDGRVAVWKVRDVVRRRAVNPRSIPVPQPAGGAISMPTDRLVAAWREGPGGLVPQENDEDSPWVNAPDADGLWSVEGSVLRRGSDAWTLPGRELLGVRGIDEDHVWLWVDQPWSEIVNVRERRVVARLQGSTGRLEVEGGTLRNGAAAWSWPDLRPLRAGPLHDGGRLVPAVDGEWRVTADSDGQVLLWRKGGLERALWGFADHVSSVAVAGGIVAIAGVRRVENGVWLAQLPGGDPSLLEIWDAPTDVSLSPDGTTLIVIVDEEYRPRIEAWDVATRTRRWQVEGAFQHIAFASHGRFFVASGWKEPRVVVFDSVTGKRHRELLLPGGFDEHNMVDIVSDRVLLGHSRHAETVDRIWVPRRSDVEVDLNGPLAIAGGGGRVLASRFTDDGEELVALDVEGQVLWTQPAENVFEATWSGDEVVWMRTDYTVASARIPRPSRLPEPDRIGDLSGLGLAEPPKPLTSVRTVALSGTRVEVGADGRLAVAGRGLVTLLTAEGEALGTVGMASRRRMAWLWFGPDGTLVTSDGETLRALDRSLNEVASMVADCVAGFYADRALTCVGRRSIQGAQDGERGASTPLIAPQTAASANGVKLLVAHDRSVEAFQGGVRGDRLQEHWSHVQDISVAGDEVAVAGSGVVLLSADRVLDGMPGYPVRVALSPDGRRVAVLDDRGEAWVWDPSGVPLGRVDSPLGGDADIAWTPDGNTLVTVDDAGVQWWSGG